LPLFDLLSPDSIRLITLAKAEAMATGRGTLAPQHLLIALLQDGPDHLKALLRSWQISETDVRAFVELRGPSEPGGLGFDHETATVLKQAQQHAVHRTHPSLTPAHMLLALMETSSPLSGLLRGDQPAERLRLAEKALDDH
jgi:ATP-dependent Clp protease ATP-binding subunit ClpA